jgi:hypothetical protein
MFIFEKCSNLGKKLNYNMIFLNFKMFESEFLNFVLWKYFSNLDIKNKNINRNETAKKKKENYLILMGRGLTNRPGCAVPCKHRLNRCRRPRGMGHEEGGEIALRNSGSCPGKVYCRKLVLFFRETVSFIDWIIKCLQSLAITSNATCQYWIA